MFEVAKLLDMISNGFIEAWHVTLVSFVGHIVVLLALVDGRLGNAALLITGFGLLDALDGAVAKLHKTANLKGMLLDSTSDRFKEALVFAGLAYYFSSNGQSVEVLYTVLALGMSFLVSYIRSKGEVALAVRRTQADSMKDINREIEDGIFGYEVRTFIIIVALAIGQPFWGVVAVLAGATFTALRRFNAILKRLEPKNGDPKHKT